MDFPVRRVGMHETLGRQPVNVVHVGMHVAQDKILASQNVPGHVSRALGQGREPTYSALRLDASVKSMTEPGPPLPLLVLRVGLMMPSQGVADPGAGG